MKKILNSILDGFLWMVETNDYEEWEDYAKFMQTIEYKEWRNNYIEEIKKSRL